ncbi:hypothetical protein NYE67_20405 [Solibacillus sp. FSL W8-0474]|uniref:hypothetical protein n=1 Tax=Solibacillus sp. FSL W8-0474 TaxID=2975336 RepID=UPI0030FB5602
MIKPAFLTDIKNFAKNHIKKGRITLNGVNIELPIYRVVENGDQLIFYLYVEDQQGFISHAALLDGNGREMQEKFFSINKGINGYTIAMPILLRVEGTT